MLLARERIRPAGFFQPGYLDKVFEIFQFYEHPVVLIEGAAMRWMGIDCLLNDNIDLLVSDDLFQVIKYDIEDYAVEEQPVSTTIESGYAGLCPAITIWTESLYKLSVDDGSRISVFGAEVENMQPILLESSFASIPQTSALTRPARTVNGIRFIREVSCQNRSMFSRRVPIFIPSIGALCNALMEQRFQHDMVPSCANANLLMLITQLDFRHPEQRKLILSKLEKKWQPMMMDLIDKSEQYHNDEQMETEGITSLLDRLNIRM